MHMSKNTATIYLFGQKMKNMEQTHRYLMRKLEFPDCYGKNLDALFDVLTENGTERRIVLLYARRLREHLGNDAERLIQVFSDAAAENPRLRFELREGRSTHNRKNNHFKIQI